MTQPRQEPFPGADKIAAFFDTARVKGQMLAGALDPRHLVKPLAILATTAALAMTPVAGAQADGPGVSPYGGTFAIERQLTMDPETRRLGYGLDHKTGVGTRVDMTESILNPQIDVATIETDRRLAAIDAKFKDRTPVEQVTATRHGAQVHARLQEDSGFMWRASLDRVIDFDAREICYNAKGSVFFNAVDQTRCLSFADLPERGKAHIEDIAQKAGIPWQSQREEPRREPIPPLPPQKPAVPERVITNDRKRFAA